MRPGRLAVFVTLLNVVIGSRALAADEEEAAHAIFEASTSRGTTVGAWEFRQAYSVSVLRLGESGQGFGARVTLLPASSFSSTWELSADAVARITSEGPLYLKPMGGMSVAPSGAGWSPRIRGGAELGLTTILGSIGLEAGFSATYSFMPSRPLEGEWVAAAGVGILFGFDAPSPPPVATLSEDPAAERRSPEPWEIGRPPWERQRPWERQPPKPPSPQRVVLAEAAFNTCEGSRATPQCLQAMSASDATVSTSATSPPAAGTTTSTAVPTGGAATSTVPASVPATTAAGVSLKPLGIIGSIGAAMGLRSDEERVRQAEYKRLMKESARTLEEVKGQAQELVAGPDSAAQAKSTVATQVDKEGEKKKLGRIYVTYAKHAKRNAKTNRYYVGRTSMIVDLALPLEPQARAAVFARDVNHHIDESDDPKDPAFGRAEYDKFDVGAAIDYENRYRDEAYFRIRGREQQLIDFNGGAQSDTGSPYRTENVLRAVAKDNPQGRLFHEAATAKWGQLYRYTGY